MKALKGILVVLVLVIVVLLVCIFTIDGKYDVQTTVSMKASPTTVQAIASDLSTWEEWGVWVKNDPTMKLSYGEPSSGIDGNYSWTGETGNGKLTIVGLEEGKSMNTLMEFEGMGNSNGLWQFDPTEEGTDVTWGMSGEFGAMGKAYMLFTGNKDINAAMNEMAQSDLKGGLENMKVMAEAQEWLTKVKIEEVTVEPLAYYSITEEIAITDMTTEFFGARFGELMAFLGSDGAAAMSGMPFSIFHMWDEENMRTKIEVCIPTSIEIEESDRIKKGMSHSGKALKAVHNDSYNTENEHNAMYAYMTLNNLEATGGPWEIYATDPTIDPIVVELYYPVQAKEEESGND